MSIAKYPAADIYHDRKYGAIHRTLLLFYLENKPFRTKYEKTSLFLKLVGNI